MSYVAARNFSLLSTSYTTGEVVDLPAQAMAWLIRWGAIEPQSGDVAPTPYLASPLAWYDAEDMRDFCTNGGPAHKSWPDRSGNELHLFRDNGAGTGATWLDAATPLGTPAVRFNDGTNAGTYHFPGPMWAGTSNAVGITLFAVVYSDPASGEVQGPWRIEASNISFYPYSTGVCNDGAFTNGRSQWTPTMTVRQVWRVYAVRMLNGTWTHWLNGTQQHQQGWVSQWPTETEHWYIGGGGTAIMLGKMAEMFIMGRGCTDTEVGTVTTALLAKHVA